MRRLLALVILVVLAALVASARAAAAPPDSGFVIYKDLRARAVTEVRDTRGHLVSSEGLFGNPGNGLPACLDPRHRSMGPRWRSVPGFLVNRSSVPLYLDAGAAIGQLVAGNQTWQSPFTTDCLFTLRPARYSAVYAGETAATASLADGVTLDGLNVVEFRSLAGTICDGALACTIIDYERGRIIEVDMLFESDLGRFGYSDLWTTDQTTWIGPTEGAFALVDVAAHEFGHFAGLDHVDRSPNLTMYPLIHDGMQTLGLGDMRGLVARY